MRQAAASELGTWDLAVLCLVHERAMHPYEMMQVLRERHKDDILDLKQGSLYHAIGRLERREFILPREVGREGRRPERTTYELTEAGRTALFARLRSLVADPQWQANDFMTSLSFLILLGPAVALAEFEIRAERLDAQIARQTEIHRAAGKFVERLNLLDLEYEIVMQTAERRWVGELIEDLRSGRLDWDLEAILRVLRKEPTK